QPRPQSPRTTHEGPHPSPSALNRFRQTVKTMTSRPRSREDAAMNQQGRGDAAALRSVDADPATWAWAAVAVGIVDAIAFGVLGVIAAIDHVHAPTIETGSVINIVAGPTFPLLAALLLRYRDRHKPVRYDRLAWLFLALGLLCTGTYVVFVYAWHGLHYGGPFTSGAVWIESWLWTSVVPGVSLLLLWFPT